MVKILRLLIGALRDCIMSRGRLWRGAGLAKAGIEPACFPTHAPCGRRRTDSSYFMSFTVASSAWTRPFEQALLNSSLSIVPSLSVSIMVKSRTRGTLAPFANYVSTRRRHMPRRIAFLGRDSDVGSLCSAGGKR
jgi:hypothetical protein